MQDRKYASDLENEGHVHQGGKCKLKAADLSVKERQFPASTVQTSKSILCLRYLLQIQSHYIQRWRLSGITEEKLPWNRK